MYSSGTALPPGIRCTITSVYDGSGLVAGISIYVDGKPLTMSTSGTVSGSSISTTSFKIGNWGSYYANAAKGSSIYLVYIWNRTLTQPEIQQLYLEPYCFIRPVISTPYWIAEVPLTNYTKGEAPHGAVCGRLLPFVAAANIKALRECDPGASALERFLEAARIFTGDTGAAAEDGAAWLQALCDRLDVPALSVYGFAGEHAPDLIAASMRSSSMKGNPVDLTARELENLLEQAQ